MRSGSGNTGSTAMRTYGSIVEMLQSFFQFKDGKLNEARHESWLGQDPGGELSIAASKQTSHFQTPSYTAPPPNFGCIAFCIIVYRFQNQFSTSQQKEKL